MKEPLAEGNQHTQLWRLIERVDRPQAIHASTYSSASFDREQNAAIEL